MEIKQFTSAELATEVGDNAGKFNIAVNQIIVADYKNASAKHNVYVNQQDSPVGGTLAGGTSAPITNVHPAYFPVATKGAECAALVTNLSWADSNLYAGYEYFILSDTGTGAARRVTYFVSGILNSTQTEANDPFGTQGAAIGFQSGCCWSGDYTVGLNPFA